MNREEILAKSRAENVGADERAAYIGLQGAHFSMGVLIVLWVVLAKTADLAPVARCAMGLLVNAACFSNFGYQFVRNRTKTACFFCAAFLAATLFYLTKFLKTAGV